MMKQKGCDKKLVCPIHHFPEETKENHENPQSGLSAIQQRFKPSMKQEC
jgi:hypothetical protein